MVSELIDKYVWLIQTFIDAGNRGISLDEIMVRWENRYNCPYSRRTFNNHREVIAEVFGIEIECDRRNNRYFIRYGKDAIDQKSSIGWLINTFTVNNLLTLGQERLSGRVAVEDIPSGQVFLTGLISAMESNKVITLDYRKYGQEEVNTFTVEPYALKEYQKRWYLLGYCHERGAERIYSLDRISSIKQTGWTFKMPEGYDIDEIYSQTIGIYLDKDSEAEFIYMRVSEREAAYLRDLPLHPSQVETGQENGRRIFRIHVVPNSDLLMEIKRLGKDVEVLSPASVRETIARELREAAAQYD